MNSTTYKFRARDAFGDRISTKGIAANTLADANRVRESILKWDGVAVVDILTIPAVRGGGFRTVAA